MHGFIRAIARLFVMGAVMGAVVVGALVAGIGTVTAVALGVVLASAVGLFGILRRPARSTPSQESEAMLAADPLDGRRPEAPRVEPGAPEDATPVDPEANMPRWRRPSLLEARRSDPTRRSPVEHMPMRFGGDATGPGDVRVVRYAVVPVLDHPDEVHGVRLSDLGSGDEVQVLGASGAFLEVLCPNGQRGFVHRTTLGQRGPAAIQDGISHMPQEADDALTAMLTARGLS